MNIGCAPISFSSRLMIIELVRVFLPINAGSRHRIDKILDGLSPSQVVGDDDVVNDLLQRGCRAVQDLPEFEGTDLLRDLPFEFSH